MKLRDANDRFSDDAFCEQSAKSLRHAVESLAEALTGGQHTVA